MHRGKVLNGGWAAVLLGSNRRPGTGHIMYVDVWYHWGWLDTARLKMNALHHEAATKACDLVCRM